MSEAELAEKIDRQRVEDLTTKFQEPSWLRENRLRAWEAYLQTPMPTTRDEEWRRTDLSGLDLTKLRAFDLAPAKQVDTVPSLPSWFSSAVAHFEKAFGGAAKGNAGIVYQTTKNGGYLHHRQDLSERGIIFCDLATAIENHADKIKPYLFQQLAAGKFNLLTQALYNCGAFLYIPANVEIKEPFLLGLGFSAQSPEIGGAIFPRVIVVAEANSKASLAFLMGTEDDNALVGYQTSLASILIDAHVKSGAQFNLIEVQELGPDVFAVEDTSSHVSKDAQFNSMSVAVGGSQTKADISTYLQSPGASSNVLGVLLGAGKEHFNFNTVQEHNAPDTTSNINYRVALKEQSSSVYQGIIRVAQNAQRTNAYQSNKNLLLSGEATADSVPKLEILANDVKCSHGATVGPIDKEQLFYLQSRGLTTPEAEDLVLLGFFKQVVEQVPIAEAQEWLTDVVSRKAFRK